MIDTCFERRQFHVVEKTVIDDHIQLSRFSCEKRKHFDEHFYSTISFTSVIEKVIKVFNCISMVLDVVSFIQMSKEFAVLRLAGKRVNVLEEMKFSKTFVAFKTQVLCRQHMLRGDANEETFGKQFRNTVDCTLNVSECFLVWIPTQHIFSRTGLLNISLPEQVFFICSLSTNPF